jgi:hypothetical protein
MVGPLPSLETFFQAHSLVMGQWLVASILVPDSLFEVWFKKVCRLIFLLSSFDLKCVLLRFPMGAKDIEAVFDEHPQHVCIFLDPVAAKGATVKCEGTTQ